MDAAIRTSYAVLTGKPVLEQIKSGQKFYQFIEVMTCSGGCICGGGQPKDKIMRIMRLLLFMKNFIKSHSVRLQRNYYIPYILIEALIWGALYSNNLNI